MGGEEEARVKETRLVDLAGRVEEVERDGDLLRIGSSGDGRRVGEKRACIVTVERENGE